MPMQQDGLAKLSEECGELTQVAAKLIAYPHLRRSIQQHPDGTILRLRLEEEMADVLAAIEFVSAKLGLSAENIGLRTRQKLQLFNRWDAEEQVS